MSKEVEIPVPPRQANLPNENRAKSKRRIFKAIRELTAITVWCYVLIKLFFFDIDTYLINKYLPNYAWLIYYKFLFLIGTIAFIWIFTKNSRVLGFMIYVIFYPLILVIWKIPKFLFEQQSWNFAFAIINALISFIKSAKYNFILFAFYVISAVIIFKSSHILFLWGSIIVLFGILMLIYAHKIIQVFKPSSIYQLHNKLLARLRIHGSFLFTLEENIKNLPVEKLNKYELEQRTKNLQTSVLFNRICLFTARKLRNYQNSGFNRLSDVVTLILLLLLTIFTFTMINLGLYEINNDYFILSEPPRLFNFFYYSIHCLWLSSVNEIIPIATITKTAKITEAVLASFILAIYVSSLFSIKGKKDDKELNEVIKSIEKQGYEMESFIRDEYKINNIADAMAELNKLQASLTKILYKITENIK